MGRTSCRHDDRTRCERAGIIVGPDDARPLSIVKQTALQDTVYKGGAGGLDRRAASRRPFETHIGSLHDIGYNLGGGYGC